MVEYALVTALCVTVLIGAIQSTTTRAGGELDERGARAGAPDVDAVGSTPTVPTVPPASNPSDDPADAGPAAVVVAALDGCWTPSGGTWGATFTFQVTEAESGAPVADAVVVAEARIFTDQGLRATDTISNAMSSADGRVVITRHALVGSGPPGGRDGRVELVLLQVSGPSVAGAALDPPLASSVARAAVEDRC